MNKKTKYISIISSCALVLLGFVLRPQLTAADEISVSGNGSDSSNAVNITTTQQTNIQQANNTQATNNIKTISSTGNNTVSNNTGNAAVKTGDATASTIVNTAANVSSVNTSAGQNSSATVSENGEGSTNTINVSSSNNSTVSINQNASLTNNVAQVAVTGHNTTNNNSGDVSIKTGNSIAQIALKNGPVNVANVTVPQSANDSYEIKIAGNGANSGNAIQANENNTTVITVSNCATVINNLKAKYITGESAANKNTGQVNIVTGNVLASINVENTPINVSNVAVNQKTNQKPSAPSSPTPVPTSNSVPSSSSSSSPSSASGSSGSTSGGPGSVMGASANSLPVTGNYWFFIAFIGNILMMLLGGYLRLRSGRSPGFAVAI